jgi:predicted amidophosphoribosyltransferase
VRVPDDRAAAPAAYPAPSPTAAEPAGSVCASCGSPLSRAAKFCGMCGTPVVTAEPPAGKFCGSCGAALSVTTKFCGSCGTAVNTAPGR